MSNEQLCESPLPLLYSEIIGDRHNGAPLHFQRSFLRRAKEESLSLHFSVFPLLSLAAILRFSRKDEDEQRADQCRGWEGRANRERLGLFASYRVGVKINVNFAVELISPAPINPTNFCLSLSSLFSSFYIAFSPCYSLSFPLSMSGFPYQCSITDISSRPTLPHPEPSSSFLKLENFRGEKKHRVSAAFGKKLSCCQAPFPGSFPAGIRALFVAITYTK